MGQQLQDCDALLQGTQARNPRPDREEGLGAASRKGRAWHRRRRPDEGRRPDPWRVLRPFRFARGAGDRGLCLRDGPLDRALAQAGGSHAAGKADGDHRGSLSHARCTATIPAMAAPSRRWAGNRPREPEDPQGVRGQAGADDRHARGTDAGSAAQGRAQAGDGGDRDHGGDAGAGPHRRVRRIVRRNSGRRT